MPKLTSGDWMLLTFSAITAIAYGLLGSSLPDWGASLEQIAGFKGLSVMVLVALAGERKLLAAALFFGALGDFALVFGGVWFLAGAGSFLVGHLCYILLFAVNGARLSALRSPLRLIGVAALGGAAISLTAVLVPASSELFLPLCIYTGVLTLMATTSLTLPAKHWLAMIGAALFLISDGFVAANMFHPQSDPGAAFAMGFTGWMIEERRAPAESG